MNPVKLCRLHSRVCRNCDAHNIFSSSDTSSIKPTQYEVVSFYSQLHSFFSLRFLPVVRLIECLQVNLAGQRANFAVASPPPFPIFSVRPGVKNKRHKSLHCSGLSPVHELELYIHKNLQHVCMCRSPKQMMKANILGWPIFFCFPRKSTLHRVAEPRQGSG